jgi:hypothetical protein
VLQAEPIDLLVVRSQDVIGFAFCSHDRLFLLARGAGDMRNSRVGELQKQGQNSGSEFPRLLSFRAAQTASRHREMCFWSAVESAGGATECSPECSEAELREIEKEFPNP